MLQISKQILPNNKYSFSNWNFSLVLKLTPIAKDASMEHLCTEFNHLRFNRTNDAISGNFDG